MIITNTKDTLAITFGSIPANPADITLSAEAGLSIANKSCTSCMVYVKADADNPNALRCYYDAACTQKVYVDEARELLKQGQIALLTIADGNTHFADKFEGSLGYIGQVDPDFPSFDIMYRCFWRN